MKALAIILVLAGLACAALAGLSAVGIMPSLVNGVFSIGGEYALGGEATSTIIWGWFSALLLISAIPFAVLATKTN